ncbi:MAG: (d)CMP kinase [Betaproteobacteria bacterium]|nr:(d)CMP kinase [Betaproteobacteria bacterium]
MSAGAAAMAPAPVIAIDGPTASGKGTVALEVARALGWHMLDSGALYRLLAWQALGQGVALDDASALGRLAEVLPLSYTDHGLMLAGRPVGDEIRQEAVGVAASRIAALGPVRQGLLAMQRAARRPPGLVADGRDMGTVVFPDAPLKIFLTASAASRAERRYKQLIEKGISASLPGLLQDLLERDARDTHRALSPLQAAEGAVAIDSTQLDISQTVERVLQAWRRQGG